MREILISSPFNHLTASKQSIFEEIGGVAYLGKGLLEQIDIVIEENNLAPSIALTNIQKIESEANQFYQRISEINSAFTKMGIEYTNLDEGETEIGIIIPRGIIEPNLDTFSKELKSYNFALNAFEEIVGQDKNSTSLKLVSSSDWQIYLGAVPILLLVLSNSLKQLVSILQSVVELKKSWSELVNKEVPKAITDELKGHIDQEIDSKIRALAESIVDENYKSSDKGRVNELKNHTTQSLKFFASKIDMGVQIELRIQPTEHTEADDANGEKEKVTNLTRTQITDVVNQNNYEIAEFSSKNNEPLKLISPDFNEEKPDKC